MSRYKLYTDGGSRGNPGPAAIGYLIFEDESLLDFGAGFVGQQTNNYAEYSALIEGLTLAKKHKIKKIECFLDSELIVKQLNGEYKVKNENIKPLFKKVESLRKNFDGLSFIHVKREFNKHADKLVNIVLDTKASSN